MPSSLRLGYALAALIVAIWTGFIVVSRLGGTGHLTPFDVVAIRLGTAALLVLPLWLRGMRRLDGPIAALTLTGGLGYTMLAYSGFHLAPAAHAGILMTGSQPLTMALCAWAVTGERPSPRRWAGIAIIILGGTALSWSAFGHGLSTWPGDLMFLGASLCWALYTVLARRWAVSPLDVTVNVAVLAAALYLPVYAVALPKHIAAASPGEIVLQALYQGALAAVIQMVIYMRAVELLGPTRMGMLVALVPILAAFAAMPILHEPLTAPLAVSMVLVSAGVLVGNAGPRAPRPALDRPLCAEEG